MQRSEPHPIFVIILVGSTEVPFGVQRDVLCAKAPYYRQQFANANQAAIEHIVKLPDTNIGAFGCFQTFLYTGKVYITENGEEVPEYSQLLDVWKLASKMQMPALRVAVLNAMADRRSATSMIPGTRLIIQAWKETEEGSGLRLMLIGWAAEHSKFCFFLLLHAWGALKHALYASRHDISCSTHTNRSTVRANAHSRNEFARALPQEILSELVITMSGLPPPPASIARPAAKHAAVVTNGDAPDVDHLHQGRPPAKRARKSAGDALMIVPDGDYDVKPVTKKPARKSEPNRRASAVRRNVEPVYATAEEDVNWTPAKEMEYCRGLIDRMIQGPGFWTRLVKPFKYPVDPEVDQVPNYFDVVKRPMDLNTIRSNIHAGVYATGAEFEADIRQIFQNCYEYWTPADRIWDTCEAFEKYFNDQWGNRHRWGSSSRQRIKAETID